MLRALGWGNIPNTSISKSSKCLVLITRERDFRSFLLFFPLILTLIAFSKVDYLSLAN